MPITLSSTMIQEKNKLAGGAQTVVALEITIPGVVDPVRICSDDTNLSWNGETWTTMAFEIEEITDQSTGEIPRVDLRIGNVTGIIGALLREYDDYCKTNGASPLTLSIYVVNKAVIAGNPNAAPEVSYVFDLKQQKAGTKWATLTLGAPNLYGRRFPLNRMLKNHCRFKFKDNRCDYGGAETSCSHTLARCRELGNSSRFGGAPGVGKGGIVVN